jgi:hypothetical protein
MNTQRTMLLLALGLLLMPACSGAEQAGPTTTALDAVTTATASLGSQISVEPVPPPELDPSLTGDDLLVAIEARWMCDVQRFAFSDLGAMNEALDKRLSPHELSRGDYETFKAELETRIDLRQQVLGEYDSYCTED